MTIASRIIQTVAMSGALLLWPAAALWPTAAAAVPTPRPKPAPVSAPSLTSDRGRLSAEIDALSRRDFPRAAAIVATLTSPTAKAIGQWLFLTPDNPLITPAAAGAFLDGHHDWPWTGRIQANAENRLNDATDTTVILNFFRERDPVTGAGRVQLARALYAKGEKPAADLQLRKAWRDDDFQLADEIKLLSTYGAALTTDDHIARADRLLWSREPVSARRVFSHLPDRERRMGEARAALLSGAPEGPALFDALPSDDHFDPGVLHAAIRYYRRHDSEPRAVELTRLLPADPTKLRDAGRLWEERQLLMRWALTERHYADAYSLAANSGLENGADFAEAEFAAGWIALRFLKAPERARIHFAALAGGVTAPISKARAFYWLGRAAAASGDDALAERRFRAAAAYPFTYYGQLAAERLGEGVVADTMFPSPARANEADRAKFASRSLARALDLLTDIPNAENQFLIFSYALDDQLESPGEYLELQRLAERRGAMHAAVRAGKAAVGRGVDIPEVSYPLIDVPDAAARFAPREVILGLARQESEFNPKAYSSAGARGLMQLIPSTAQITARQAGLNYSRLGLLNDPRSNLIIGAAHLSQLLSRFDGSYLMTFAAYNAGANRVDEWVGRYGDPRAADVDPIDWIEQIPFQETRNYVQRVLENTQIYRSRLTQKPIPGRLSLDLERGGAPNRSGRIPAIKAAELPSAPQRTFRLASLAGLDSAEDTPALRLKPPADDAAQPLPQPASEPSAAAAQIPQPAPQPSPSPAAGPTSVGSSVITDRSRPRAAPRPAPAVVVEDDVAAALNRRALAAARGAAPDDGEEAPRSACATAETTDGGTSDDEAGPEHHDPNKCAQDR